MATSGSCCWSSRSDSGPDWIRRRLPETHPAELRKRPVRAASRLLAQVLPSAWPPRNLGRGLSVAGRRSTQHLAVPVFKGPAAEPRLVLHVPFVVFVLVGASNSVNLTDGLDGLAIVPVMIVGLLLRPDRLFDREFAVFSRTICRYTMCRAPASMAVFCGAMVGASLGFLWYNAPPAMVFMGDTGSLSCGGALGGGGGHYQTRIGPGDHRRPVRPGDRFGHRSGRFFQDDRAPGLPHGPPCTTTSRRRVGPEPTIVIRFWIIASILALAGLATLKLR